MRRGLLIISIIISLGISAQKNFRIYRLKFNSPVYNEMSPAFYKDGIVFSSDQTNSMVAVTGPNNRSHYNLYYVEKNGGQWGHPRLFAKNIRSKLDEASACFSSDLTTMFFTQSNDVGLSNIQLQKVDTIKQGIMQADFTGKYWEVYQEFPFSEEGYNYKFPYLTPDGNELYFASDMPGGYGGYDIYVSEKEAGTWQMPMNMGDEINTPENEVFPFYHESGRLYFSSRGHGERSDLNIFYTEKIDGKWIRPIKLSRPFNLNRRDDYGFVLSPKMDTGYFVSNRKGSDDIFMFVSSFPVFKECSDQVSESFCYQFEETSVSLEDLDTNSFKYEWDFGDGNKERSITAEHCYKNVGTYVVSLNVIDGLTGEVYFSQVSYELNVEPKEQPFITAPDTAFVDEELTLDAVRSEIRGFKPEDYFWDLGNGNIEDGLEIEYSYPRAGTYYIRLGITDGEENDEDEEIDFSKRACSQKKDHCLE